MEGRDRHVRAIRSRFEALAPVLDERVRRLWAAAEAQSLGRGGLAVVEEATGIAHTTILRGLKDLREIAEGSPEASPQGQRVRRPGAGRKSLAETDPALLVELEKLVDPVTRGEPESPLRWTSKSVRKLADELSARGHNVGRTAVRRMLRELGYSLQANRKTTEGNQHPDRNAQFEHINATATAFQDRGQPVISVDTKKKELVGDFKNGGREWRPQGDPERVRVHDFADKELGKVIPYGVLDVSRQEGWVSVGVNHDTAEFAVQSIKRWWQRMGRRAYPAADELLITADCGGSNGNRTRLWKTELQELANATGLTISVCHYPPGTSKWNKIEHQLFSRITENWRAQPLVSREVVVNLIANTRTRTGLKVRAALDTRSYEKGVRVSKELLAAVNLKQAECHGEWNCTILPKY